MATRINHVYRCAIVQALARSTGCALTGPGAVAVVILGLRVDVLLRGGLGLKLCHIA